MTCKKLQLHILSAGYDPNHMPCMGILHASYNGMAIKIAVDGLTAVGTSQGPEGKVAIVIHMDSRKTWNDIVLVCLHELIRHQVKVAINQMTLLKESGRHVI